MPPRFFHPSGEPRPLPEAPLAEVCDVVRLGAADVEHAVVRDAVGTLRLVESAALPEALERAVHAHEFTRGRPRRLLVAELWLFDLQVVQARRGAAAVNVPIEVFGRLFGPFGGAAAPASWDGQLSLTRLDLLAGFAAEAPSAFTVDAEAGAPGRCLHGWLPAEREEAIAQGAGAVLAFKLHPADLGAHGGNEALVAELLHTELDALREALAAVDAAHPLVRAELPVPDREAVVASMRADGWVVEGDKATRTDGIADQVAGALAGLFGGTNPLARAVPRQGSVDEFVTLATTALARTPGWPDPRANALRARVRHGELAGLAVAPGPAALPPDPRPPPPRHVLPPSETTWLDDFAPGRPPPPAGRPAGGPPKRRAPKRDPGPPRGPGRPEWMDDFDS